MPGTEMDDDADQHQAPSTPLERNVFGAYPFSKNQEQYIVQLREEEEDRLQWSEISRRFNQRYPDSPRSKGALQVHYSRSLQPGKRAKSRRDHRPSSASSTTLQQLRGPCDDMDIGNQEDDEGAEAIVEDKDGSRLPKTQNPSTMAESELSCHSTSFTLRPPSRHTRQNPLSNIDKLHDTPSTHHADHPTKQQTSSSDIPFKSDLEIQQLIASGNKRARTQKSYQEVIQDSHDEEDDSSLTSVSDTSSETESAELFSHLDVVDPKVHRPAGKTASSPPASARRKLVLKLNKQTSQSQKQEPPTIRLADTDRPPVMPHQMPEKMQEEPQKATTRGPLSETQSRKKHEQKEPQASTNNRQSGWTIIDPAELTREEHSHAPDVLFNPPRGRITEISANGNLRTRARKAGEKLPVFESGFYEEPWYFPEDGIKGAK